jgi:hypothetical protein
MKSFHPVLIDRALFGALDSHWLKIREVPVTFRRSFLRNSSDRGMEPAGAGLRQFNAAVELVIDSSALLVDDPKRNSLELELDRTAIAPGPRFTVRHPHEGALLFVLPAFLPCARDSAHARLSNSSPFVSRQAKPMGFFADEGFRRRAEGAEFLQARQMA